MKLFKLMAEERRAQNPLIRKRDSLAADVVALRKLTKQIIPEAQKRAPSVTACPVVVWTGRIQALRQEATCSFRTSLAGPDSGFRATAVRAGPFNFDYR